MDLFQLNREEQLRREGWQLIAGVDEAGRGPLAGPVVAAAVILPDPNPIPGLRDSKKLTPGIRKKLAQEIIKQAIAWAVDLAGVEEINTLNILRASLLAMERAVCALKVRPQYILIDGNQKLSLAVAQEPVIKGDSTCPSIAAASILAKVYRDWIMKQMDLYFPQYQFARHKGYPTPQHRQIINQLGPCPLHRWRFISRESEGSLFFS